MTVLSAKITIDIPWASSLKNKRQVRRSIIDKTRQKYNAAVAEVGTEDSHRTLTIGFAVVSGESHHAREMAEDIVRYIQSATDAEVRDIAMDEHGV